MRCRRSSSPACRLFVHLLIPVFVVFGAACSGGDGGEQADNDNGVADAGTDADAGSLPVTEATVSVGETAVSLSVDPFRIEVRDGDGELRSATAESDRRAFSGLGFARAEFFDADSYYNPKLEENDGDGHRLQWFHPAEVVSAEVSEERATFVVATMGPDGESGPEISLVLEAGGHSVVLAIEGPEDPAWVHTSLSLIADEDEAFFGLGEHFDRLDGRGLVREMQVQAEPDSESAINEVHVPIPFLLSSKRYGLFVDDRHPAAFDLGASVDDVMRVTFSSRTPVYHFFVDDDPLQLVEAYTDVTGKPAHVPFWALAPQWWRNENEDQAEVIEDAERGRQFDIPSTVMWIDRPWQSAYQNWRFSDVQFPDPQAMMERLHDLGHRVVLHHSPQMNVAGSGDGIVGPIDDSEALFDRYEDNDWLVKLSNGQTFVMGWGGGNGGFVDFSDPEAVADVQEMLTRVTDLGVVGTKMDWDEYLQPNVGSFRIPLVFANGETNMTMKGWYSALYHKAIIEGFDAGADEPTFHISRSGAPGDQQWNTCIWPGDLDNDFSEHTRGPSDFQEEWNVGGMPAAIIANQSLGMTGYPCFGSDIGGYRGGAPTAEVMQRWMAFGAFNTVMQLGGGGKTHMAWSSDSPYGEEVLETTRKYFKLRMELFPYVFHHLLNAERTGRPVVRSLWLSYPDDERTRDFERDFLFGPDLLVAPVFAEGAAERELYLPDGDWVDFWTGERVAGGQAVTRQAPIDVIPVYLRSSAIVPLADAGIDTLVDATDEDITSYQDVKHTRFLLVPAEESNTLSLFNGVQITSGLDGDEIAVELAIGEPDAEIDERAAFAPEQLTLHVQTDGLFAEAPSAVEVDGQALAEAVDDADCRPCWRYDAERSRVDVHLDGDGAVRLIP